jgi:endonuclease/exonuclease/phosphatase family metal-dependent hydrolase
MPAADLLKRGTVQAALIALAALLASPARAADMSSTCAPLPVTTRAVAPSDIDSPPRNFTVASLNVAGQQQIADALTAWTAARGIDILLLQEVGHDSFDGAAFVSALSERLKFHFVYAPANVFSEGKTQGLAIVSRYPLDGVRVLPLTYHRLRFKSRCRIALAVRARTTDGPVELVNVHLDTRINSKERIAQLAPVLDALNGDDSSQLIGGDFNTMNIFWFRTMWPFVYLQKQTVAVAERLGAVGFRTPFRGTPATFKFMHLPLRLDWLYLKRLKPLDWSVDTVPLTDHRGVWARVGE